MGWKTWSKNQFPVDYGRYTLLSRIAFGGMAEVFKAQLKGAAGFERPVVIKRILPHLASEEMVQSLLAEAKVNAAIHHRNVVQIIELQQAGSEEYYLVLEHVDGVDLRILIRAALKQGVRIPVWFSLYIVSQVLTALAHIHDLTSEDEEPLCIIHRDVSPSNVFISNCGDVKLGDFGVVKSTLQSHVTKSGVVKGKLEYAAPEQVLGDTIDHRIDLFSTGVVLWELLAQRKLFRGDSEWEVMQQVVKGDRFPPSRFQPDIPEQIDALVLAALDVEQKKRPQRAQHFLREVLQILSELRPVVMPNDIEEIYRALLGDPRSTVTLEPLSSHEVTSILRKEFETPDDPADITSRPPIEDDEDDEEDQWEEETEAIGITDRPLTLDGDTLVGVKPFDEETVLSPEEGEAADQEDVWVELSGFDYTAVPEDASNDVLVVPLPEWNQKTQDAIPKERVHDDVVAPDLSGPAVVTTVASSFWLHSRTRRPLGPMSGEGLLQEIEQVKSASELTVAHGGGRQMPLIQFVDLTDQNRWLPEESNNSNLFEGFFTHSSLISLIGHVARLGLSGVLTVQTETSQHLLVYFNTGSVAEVLSSEPVMQLPRLLLERKLIDGTRLSKLLAEVLEQERRFDETVADSLQLDLPQIRDRCMGERICTHLSSPHATFSFDGGVLSDREPLEDSTSAFLLKSVMSGCDTDTLRAAVENLRDRQLTFSRLFVETNQELKLTLSQRRAAHYLAQGATVGAFLDSTADDVREQLAMIHVFVEMGLLLPR